MGHAATTELILIFDASMLSQELRLRGVGSVQVAGSCFFADKLWLEMAGLAVAEFVLIRARD